MKPIALIFFLFLLSFSTEAEKLHPAVKSNLKELQKLDSLLANQDKLVNTKEMKIGVLRAALSQTSIPEEKLPLARKLFDEYQYYDSDSALKYASLVYATAHTANPVNDSLVTSALIDEALLYSIQGYHNKSKELLGHITDRMIADKYLRLKYYKAREYGASMELVYAAGNKETENQIWKELCHYRDSVIKACKGMPDLYPWLPVAEKLEQGTPTIKPNVNEIDPKSLEKLHLSVDTAKSVSTFPKQNAYWLARYYKETGDSTRMIHYLIIAAQNAVINQNKELVSMPDLAGYLFQYGDLERAFNYMMYSAQQLNSYKNRNRMFMLTSAVTTVRDAYQRRIEERERLLKQNFIGIVVIALILVGALLVIINRNKKLHAVRNKLADVNEELLDAVKDKDDAITALKIANNELEQLNKVNREVIAMTFRLAALQIGRMNDFRKKLLRKYKLKQYAELGGTLADDDMVKEQYADFYKEFDRMALSIFPNLIEEFNNSCEEIVQVDNEAIKKSRSLNVRLRIYALRRLGIEKSADLAEMLNVSIRTVYNNRSTDPKNC